MSHELFVVLSQGNGCPFISIQVFRAVKGKIRPLFNGAGFIVVGAARTLRIGHEGAVSVPVCGGYRNQIVLLIHRSGIPVRVDDIALGEQTVNSAFQSPIPVGLAVRVVVALLGQIQILLVKMDLPFLPVVVNNKGPVYNVRDIGRNGISLAWKEGCAVSSRFFIGKQAGHKAFYAASRLSRFSCSPA